MTRSRDTASIIPTVDAKGDLLVGTADNTVDNLSPGTNGQFLTANSATTTGLEWTTPASTGNAIINGGFDIWQRGTSFASGSAAGYRADRWFGTSGAAQAVEQSTDVPNSNFAYSAISTTSTNAFNTLTYRIEEQQAVQLIGTATFSLYAKNLSGTTGLRIQLRIPTAKDNWASNTLLLTLVLAQDGSFDSEWQRYSVTFEVPSAVKNYGMGFEIQRTASGTTSYSITGVQLEAGTVATPFRRNANSIQAELAACQRYYWRDGGITSIRLVSGHQLSATSSVAYLSLPVTMRIAPYSVGFSSLLWTDGITADVGASAVILYLPGSRSFIGFQITHSSIGVAAKPGNLISGGTGSFLELNAEL
jgi:hypothetical protein